MWRRKTWTVKCRALKQNLTVFRAAAACRGRGATFEEKNCKTTTRLSRDLEMLSPASHLPRPVVSLVVQARSKPSFFFPFGFEVGTGSLRQVQYNTVGTLRHRLVRAVCGPLSPLLPRYGGARKAINCPSRGSLEARNGAKAVKIERQFQKSQGFQAPGSALSGSLASGSWLRLHSGHVGTGPIV